MIRAFEGKTAVVTGAASGIGLALARELSRRRTHLALLDQDPTVREVATELSHAEHRVSAHVMDVAERVDWRRVHEEVMTHHQAVHLLVNNAGVSVAARFENASQDDFEWLFGVNFWGVVHGCRTFLPTLREQSEAHIVNVCSSFAWLGCPGKSAYASSKAAVRAFTESLRAELRDTTVGATLLFPGPVDTGLIRRGRAADAQQREKEAAFVASRAVDPARVARRCLEGVRANKARVLVGMDYRLFDLGVRLSPRLALAAVGAAARRMPF